MPYPECHYAWTWHLTSSPVALWPYVSDTDHFNRDTGVPALVEEATSGQVPDGRHHLRLRRLGVPIEWIEEPFEWVRPHFFGVSRCYLRGPIAEMRILATLDETPDGGTDLTYEVRATPRNVAGLAAIPIQIGLLSRRRFAQTFLSYDRAAQWAVTRFSPDVGAFLMAEATSPVVFAPKGRERLAALRQTMREAGADEALLDRLVLFLERADDLVVAKIRPYALADVWGVPRAEVLSHFLWATRVGMLTFRWEVLCPLCRGAEEGAETLRDISSGTHCGSCNIDFTANFDRQVELTFRPNPSIRPVEVGEFCVGGPQVTPHIVAQQLVTPGESRELRLPLEAGRYRLRTLQLPGGLIVRATEGGAERLEFELESNWQDAEPEVALNPSIVLQNRLATEQLVMLERTSWSDTAVTAAEVTGTQLFRDLFSREALRPGEEISVGSLTVVFTDLRESTRLYREIGDATAFGHVLSHFDALKAAIAEEDGALVKTIGDAVMAVFRGPAGAIRALLKAQLALAQPSGERPAFVLKAGMHFGPCIAVTLNERLDYFGSTVNAAARLESLSLGGDIVMSDAVRSDPEVIAALDDWAGTFTLEAEERSLKGFESSFRIWRLRPLEQSGLQLAAEGASL